MERGREQVVRIKTTVMCRPDLWKRVRLHAVQVVEDALEAYLSRAERQK